MNTQELHDRLGLTADESTWTLGTLHQDRSKLLNEVIRLEAELRKAQTAADPDGGIAFLNKQLEAAHEEARSWREQAHKYEAQWLRVVADPERRDSIDFWRSKCLAAKAALS